MLLPSHVQFGMPHRGDMLNCGSRLVVHPAVACISPAADMSDLTAQCEILHTPVDFFSHGHRPAAQINEARSWCRMGRQQSTFTKHKVRP